TSSVTDNDQRSTLLPLARYFTLNALYVRGKVQRMGRGRGGSLLVFRGNLLVNGKPCRIVSQRDLVRFSNRNNPDLPATMMSRSPSPSISTTGICMPPPARLL